MKKKKDKKTRKIRNTISQESCTVKLDPTNFLKKS